MASEQGYTSQVMPQAAPGPVLATPDTYGAGVAASLGQLGDTVNSAQLRAYQLDREQQAQTQSADFYHRFALVRQNQDGQQNYLKSNPAAPGGQGHVDAVRQLLNIDQQNLFTGITEEKVMREAQQQWDAYSTGQITGAADWAEGQRIGKAVTDTQQSVALSANRVSTASDPSVFAQELRSSHGMVNSLQVPDDVRARMAHEVDTQLASARIDYLNRADPKASVALMDAGAYNMFLEPQQLQALRRSGEVEIRRQEAEQRQQMAYGKAQFNQQFEMLKGQAAAGQDIDVKAAGAMAQQAQAYGEPVKAQELGLLVENQGYVRQYRTLAQNPIAMQAHVSELAAKSDPSAAEQRELAWAREHASGLVSRFTGDPVGYMAQFGPAGTQPPAFDPTDPKTLVARAQWRANLAQTSGMPDAPMFSDAESAQLRQAINTGNAGRMQALGTLDALSPADRAVAARQIMPNDKLFQHEAQVDADVRAMLQHGRTAQAANQGYWPSPALKDPKQAYSAQQLANFDSLLSYSLRAMDPTEVNAAKATMRDYIAGKFAAQGRADGHSITTADLKEATAYALGGRIKNGQQYGGVGRWGPDQAYVVVPETMTASQFGRAIVGDRAAQDKAGRGPVNPDGSPFDLNRAHPVLIGDGLYRWETSSGVVLGKNRQPYVSHLGAR